MYWGSVGGSAVDWVPSTYIESWAWPHMPPGPVRIGEVHGRIPGLAGPSLVDWVQ